MEDDLGLTDDARHDLCFHLTQVARVYNVDDDVGPTDNAATTCASI